MPSSMSPEDRRAMASEIGQAVAEAVVMAEAQRRPPSGAELVQRYAAIGASVVAMLAMLGTMVSWAYQLQGSMAALSASVSSLQETTAKLDDKLDSVLVVQWSRADHEQFVLQELRPLEARVRALESRK